MQCPCCGSADTRVTSTFRHGAAVTLRYRRCRMCGHKWKSWEELDPTPVRPKRSAASDLFSAIQKDQT